MDKTDIRIPTDEELTAYMEEICCKCKRSL